ncbi:MAG: transposase [Ktedonobacterales bacterium]
MSEYRKGHEAMARTQPWELSEVMWERAQPLLPPHKPHPKGGRPPRDDRQKLGAILYVLRTGIQWNALSHAIGASTTVYDRFRAC